MTVQSVDVLLSEFGTSLNCGFLTCIQIAQEAGKMVWHSHLFKDCHSLLWAIQSKALLWSIKQSRYFSGTFLLFWWSKRCWQFDLWFLCLSKSGLNIWKFTVHISLKPGLENFEHYFTSVWDECNCVVVWAFFGIGMKTEFSYWAILILLLFTSLINI